MLTRPAKNEDLLFSWLPKDMLNLLFKDLDLQDALSIQKLGVANLNRVLQEIWYARTMRHFPRHMTPKLSVNTNWLDFFNFNTLCDYQAMSEESRELFYLAKEGRDDELLHAITSYSQLLASDINHDTLVKIARRMHKQHLLDHYYQIILPFYLLVRGDAFNTVLNRTTLFEWAIYCNQDEATLASLRDQGASIDRLTERTFSNFTRAAQNGNLVALKFLIAHHAYMDHPNISNIIAVAISAAVESYHPECITPLINYAVANRIDWKPGVGLCKAAEMGFIDILDMFLSNHANIDAVNANGETALHIAAYHKNLHVIDWLLTHKADAHARSHAPHFKMATPIIYAVIAGDSATVEKLLDFGIDVNSCDDDGYSLLHIAAKNNHLDLLRLLLHRGAAIDRNIGGTTTPLHTAVRMGHEAVCEELIKNGASVSATNYNGLTPLAIAKNVGNHRIGKLILQYYPHLNENTNQVVTEPARATREERVINTDRNNRTTNRHGMFGRSHRAKNHNASSDKTKSLFHRKK